jgi:hypothetical protein
MCFAARETHARGDVHYYFSSSFRNFPSFCLSKSYYFAAGHQSSNKETAISDSSTGARYCYANDDMRDRSTMRSSDRLLLLLALCVCLGVFLQTRLLDDDSSPGALEGSHGKLHTNKLTVLADSRDSKRSQNIALAKNIPVHTKHTSSIFHHTCSVQNRTVRVRKAPHFIIAGAQKSGTTALYEFLRQHPKMQASKKSEAHFFDWHYPQRADKKKWLEDRNFSKFTSNEEYQCALQEAYGQEFEPVLDESVIQFEKTPSYLFLTRIPKLIHDTCPWKPKIIVILRNPADRAFSQYSMGIRVNGKSFEELVDNEIENMRSIGLSHAPPRNANYTDHDPGFRIPEMSKARTDGAHWRHYRKIFANNYLQRSMYITQIDNWALYFPLRESLLVVNYERFVSHPQDVYNEILSFVGAPPFTPPVGFFDVRHNANAPEQNPLPDSLRQYLNSFFRPYNNRLADLLGEEWRNVWE